MRRRSSKPLSRRRVLVTCPDELGVLGAVRGLRAAGYEPWVAGRRASFAALSRAVAGTIVTPNAGEDLEAFAAAVAGGAADIGASLVLPGTERALVALTHWRDSFPPSCTLGVPTKEALERVTDKTRIAELTAAAGIAVPDTLVLGRSTAARSWQRDFPVVVKPPRSETWRTPRRLEHASALLAHSPEELESAVVATPGESIILQAVTPGPLESVAGVAWQGRLLAPTQARARRLWPVDCGTIAYADTIDLEPDLLERVDRLVELLEFDGLLQLQFIRGADGLQLIDINPRVYASLALAIASGRNLPAIWANLLLGVEADEGRYRPGARFRSELNDLRWIGAALRSHAWRDVVRATIPHHRIAHAIFSPGDPLPVAATPLRAFRARRGSGRAPRPDVHAAAGTRSNA